jgi:hypothetical protein
MTELTKILTKDVGGLILTNRLSYIEAAMPAGWRAACEQSAVNKIFGQARAKMQRELDGAIRRVNAGLRQGKGDGADMGRYLTRAA